MVELKPVLYISLDRWQGDATIPDSCVKGGILFIKALTRFFTIHIYSSQSSSWRGRKMMRKWLTFQTRRLFDDGSRPTVHEGMQAEAQSCMPDVDYSSNTDFLKALKWSRIKKRHSL